MCLADRAVVGRILKVHAAPVGTPWMWALALGHHEDRKPRHGYAATRGAAMGAFGKSWRGQYEHGAGIKRTDSRVSAHSNSEIVVYRQWRGSQQYKSHQIQEVERESLHSECPYEPLGSARHKVIESSQISYAVRRGLRPTDKRLGMTNDTGTQKSPLYRAGG
jgi:hypothetical protein